MSERFFNQKGLIDETKIRDTKFVVVGAGAIGSFFITGLSKMGARNIVVYDYDVLEDHNFANQMYPASALGMAKVDAIKTVASDYGDCIVTTINDAWTPDNAVGCDVFVSAVDNMDVRQSLWNHYKPRCKFYLDGRMSALFLKVFGVETDNAQAVEYYETTLHSQAVAAKERCGEKSIIYTVMLVSGFMLSQVRGWLMGEYRPTTVMLDALNEEIEKVYHKELKMVEMREDPKPDTVRDDKLGLEVENEVVGEEVKESLIVV